MKDRRFQGLYWRQLFVTAGMVLLTLCLLGVSFFSLSYNYARSREVEEDRKSTRLNSSH